MESPVEALISQVLMDLSSEQVTSSLLDDRDQSMPYILDWWAVIREMGRDPFCMKPE